jgi:hypothetical protein
VSSLRKSAALSSERPSHAAISPELRRRATELQEGVGSAFDVDYPLPNQTGRNLPDVTSLLVFVLVALGLFVVPLGATLMQNEAVAAVVLSMQ